MKKICMVVSSPMTARAFLMGHLEAMGRCYDTSVVANTEDFGFLDRLSSRVTGWPVGIERKISPWRDLAALWRLWRLFRNLRPDLVHSVSAKAGLLAMSASFLARVPVRVHTFTGQVWATRRGPFRWLLKRLDGVTASLATHVLADSDSQMRFIVSQGVVGKKGASVLAHGSISGVDTARFAADQAVRREVRSQFGVAEEDVLFLYMGRLNRDKGISELSEAFSVLAQSRKNVHLVLVGPDEEGMTSGVERACQNVMGRVHLLPYTDQPERYIMSADVLCLPSHREGFGSVVIEAAVAGVPAIGSRIYGVSDAIQDQATGLLHEPGSSEDLLKKMDLLAGDSGLRLAMGTRARERALRDFSREASTGALMDFYAARLP